MILKNEFRTVVSRPSFLIPLFLFPLFGFIIFTVAGAVSQSSVGSEVASVFIGSQINVPEGFVDESGMIKVIPDNLITSVVKLDSEPQALAQLNAGKISSYALISADYLFSGQVTLVQKDYDLFRTDQNQPALESLIAYNLLKQDQNLTQRLNKPTSITMEYVTPQAVRSQAGAGEFLVPYLIMIFLYIIITTSSSMLLTSIATEKQNRVMEILLTSATPQEMLTGKIIALGLAGLLQMVIWFGSDFLLITLAGQKFSLGPSFNLPPSILFWGIIFFLLGYALYASLMAGLGALVPNLREANQATILIIFPLIVPLLFSSSVSAAPNSPLFLTLSMIPFTSPMTMMSRLAATDVPLWQLAVSILILLLTVFFVLRSVSRLFRAQTLLSGNSFKSKDFLRALVKGKQ